MVLWQVHQGTAKGYRLQRTMRHVFTVTIIERRSCGSPLALRLPSLNVQFNDRKRTVAAVPLLLLLYVVVASFAVLPDCLLRLLVRLAFYCLIVSKNEESRRNACGF